MTRDLKRFKIPFDSPQAEADAIAARIESWQREVDAICTIYGSRRVKTRWFKNLRNTRGMKLAKLIAGATRAMAQLRALAITKGLKP